MQVLLSGSTGFLGSHLLKKLLSVGFKVIALKRSTSKTERISTFLDKVVFYDIDKTPIEEIFENHTIDIVINTVTDYGRVNKKISSILNTNLIFSINLLEVAVNNNVKAFLNTDTLLEKSINAYALSKSQFVDWMYFLSTKSTKMINIKIEHMYGPFDDKNKFIYWVLGELKKDVKKIDLTSGIQKRDFIHINDVVEAYLKVIEKIDDLENFETYELGTGNSIEVKLFIKKIYAEVEKTQKVSTLLNFGKIKYRNNENMDMKADISRLMSLGWSPKISIDEGIKSLFDGDIK